LSCRVVLAVKRDLPTKSGAVRVAFFSAEALASSSEDLSSDELNDDDELKDEDSLYEEDDDTLVDADDDDALLDEEDAASL